MTSPGKPPTKSPADQEVEDEVQEASEESFPASDPPAWTHVHPGRPASSSGDQPKPDQEVSKSKRGRTAE